MSTKRRWRLAADLLLLVFLWDEGCQLANAFAFTTPNILNHNHLATPIRVLGASRFYDELSDDDDGDEGYERRRSYWEREQVDYKRLAQDDVVQWESCATENDGTAWVLLPAASVQRPTAIIHFCGGTWLGSAPHIWYGRFLTDLVKHTSAAVIATTIPVTLFQTLDHVRLAKQITRQFETAYEHVVLEEYGVLHNQTPTVAMGHSLGARLLVIRATLGEHVGSPRRRPPPYRSAVWLSFTNHQAAAGIPGLDQLYQSAQALQEMERGEKEPQGRQRRRRRRRNEDDITRLWRQVTDSVQEGTYRMRSVLTPSPEALEFYPTPDDLWNAVSSNGGGRYNIPQTLLVQFDNDPVDQSSRLATAVAGDVRFCRLRGTHLTPVGLAGSGEEEEEVGVQRQPLGRLVAEMTRTRDNRALRELRQSVGRYITDVVTKSSS